MSLLIKNGIVLGKEVLNNGYVLIENNKITAYGTGDLPYADEVIDAGGNYISPGFIEIHSHGGGGHDFMDNTVEAFLGAAKTHLLHGTTTLYPTTVASTVASVFDMLEIYKKADKQNTDGATFEGVHLEGPYFAYEYRGAQDPKYLKNPEYDEYIELLNSTDLIKRWSLAPELDGADRLGEELVKRNILPSIAHSGANCDQTINAFNHGFTHITHFYSGMPQGIVRVNAYRVAGIIEATYLLDDMTVEIIADGHHLPSNLLKLIIKLKGIENVALVSDSMRGAGQADGESILGSLENGQKVIIEDGVAKLPDRSAFAGSVATADQLIKTILKNTDVKLPDCIKMITSTPARIMNIDDRVGKIDIGYDADITIFDKNINILNVIKKGIKIF